MLYFVVVVVALKKKKKNFFFGGGFCFGRIKNILANQVAKI